MLLPEDGSLPSSIGEKVLYHYMYLYVYKFLVCAIFLFYCEKYISLVGMSNMKIRTYVYIYIYVQIFVIHSYTHTYVYIYIYECLCYSFQPMICISYNKTKNCTYKKFIYIQVHIMIQYFLLHARRKGVTPIFNTQ